MKIIARQIVFYVLFVSLLTACSSGQSFPGTGVGQTPAQVQITPIGPATQPLPEEPGVATSSAEVSSPTESAAPPELADPVETQETINCTVPAPITPALTEGPYWKEGSPERTNLIGDGMTGTKITITGYVLDTNCQPVPGTWMDFWQADANGVYDNSGYTLRGHQFTDASGRYTFVTIVPGLYSGRTEHIHFKIQTPNGFELTSQLFFPDVSQNETDRIFDPALVLPVVQRSNELFARFNFIVQAE